MLTSRFSACQQRWYCELPPHPVDISQLNAAHRPQYSDSGWFTCQLYPGSYLNEYRDAKLFQDWGFDYLKYVCQSACPVEKTLIVTGMTTARV